MVNDSALPKTGATVEKTVEVLQKTASDLLAGKAVDLVIGYGRSSGRDIVPLFI